MHNKQLFWTLINQEGAILTIYSTYCEVILPDATVTAFEFDPVDLAFLMAKAHGYNVVLNTP
jgi:hypothetical protein